VIDKPKLHLTPKDGDLSLIRSPAVSALIARGRRDVAAPEVQPRPLPLSAPLSEIRRRAEQGDADAQFRLGDRFLQGCAWSGRDAVPQDYAEAARWFQLAAEHSYTFHQYEWPNEWNCWPNIFAQYLLGEMHERGEGFPQDYLEAARWYRKAADGGHHKAQLTLGLMYADGRGVPQDDTEAVRLYRNSISA
jgi:TPR repeat protein